MVPAKVALAVQGGVSIVCATCKHYWEARGRGVPGDYCLKEPCGGPISGNVFPLYEGPLGDFTRWCFVCGTDSSFGIQVRNHPRVIGVCSDHVKALAEFRPMGDPRADELPILLKNVDGTITLRELTGPPKKSLFKAIAEVEKYYADKEGREW